MSAVRQRLRRSMSRRSAPMARRNGSPGPPTRASKSRTVQPHRRAASTARAIRVEPSPRPLTSGCTATQTWA